MDAIEALVLLQAQSKPEALPEYDRRCCCASWNCSASGTSASTWA
jgi:hypothetical protein